jgi:dipeptidyl aminopeptidase/acylaminoacyl peptidase
VNAQENLTYQKPPQSILDLADYERAPSVSMDSKNEFMLLSYRNTYKTLDELNQDELRLGGLRINPVTNISSTVTYINNIKIRKVTSTQEMQVSGLPANPKISNISWSPDEKKIAFTHTTAKGVMLYVVDVVTAKATKLTEDNLNANLGNPVSWYNDNQNMLVKLLPQNRKPLIDSKKDLPTGPIISNADGTKSQNRTYQDLLKNKADEENFENIVTSELYKVDLAGNKTLFKSADMYAGESFSPDGNYLMLTTIKKPFSYIVPLSRFPSATAIYSSTGTLVSVVNEVPLNEIIPKGFMAVRKGKRNMSWRNDKPSTLYYVEALDEGDPAKQVQFRDEVFVWNAPFNQPATSIARTSQRFDGIIWGNDNIAMLSDEWYDTRNTRTFLINPANPSQEPKKIFDRNSQDIYSDPGSFERKRNNYGRYVLAVENDAAYLIGEGFTSSGQFPFVDEFNLKTLKSNRLYQSTFKDKKEDILSILDFKTKNVLVQIQSATEYPNYYFRNIKKNKLTQITSFKNPFESIKNVYKEVIKYKR